MSGWFPGFDSYTDLLQSDASPLPVPDEPGDTSPTHRRSRTTTPTSQPRALFPPTQPSFPAPTQPPYPGYTQPPYPGYTQPPYPGYTQPPYPFPPFPPTQSSYPPTTQPSYPASTQLPFPFPPYGAPFMYPPYPFPPVESQVSRPSSVCSESAVPSEAVPSDAPRPKKRLEWCKADEEKLVNAWITHSVDPIRGKDRTAVSFWGDIAKTYNYTSPPERHRTAKQLKDHWVSVNQKVTAFNGVYIQEERMRQSGADDAMVLDAAKQRYAQRFKHTFKWDHWWQAVRHEPKWSARHGSGSDSDGSKRTRLRDSSEYSSGGSREEEEHRPMGRDRAKAAARKEREKAKAKGKDTADSSKEGKMKKMTRLGKGLVKAKLWNTYMKMLAHPTNNMDDEAKRSHAKALKLIKKDIGIIEEESTDDEEEEEDEIENSD